MFKDFQASAEGFLERLSVSTRASKARAALRRADGGPAGASAFETAAAALSED